MGKEFPQLVIADLKGRIFNVPHLEATGMKAGRFFRLDAANLIKLPAASRLYMLPGRLPVGFDPQLQTLAALDKNPFSDKNDECYAVAAFIRPGFTATFSSSFSEVGLPESLPLFSYAAVSFYKNEFYTAAVKIDNDIRHDPRFIDMAHVRQNAARIKKLFPRNRLIKHLEGCALIYGCPNAQNFFLNRYEGPLPVSPSCNAGCPGCISYQPKSSIPCTQPRIKFIPLPKEVAEVALFHIKNTKDPIVSFGQGCEGEPLLQASLLERTIKLIRAQTRRGTINLNTNASKPAAVSRLFDAGLDTMRVSLNSAQEKYYTKYYKPGGYKFDDVIKSIMIAKEKKGFVSINYLAMPGFTDSRDEVGAFRRFIGKYKVDMVQWRNLNFDPLRYFRGLDIRCPGNFKMVGIKEAIVLLKKEYPGLMMGYFNPSKRKIML